MGPVRLACLMICFAFLCCGVEGQAERKVVCYYSNRSYKRAAPYDFTPDKIDPFLCTHIIYAFVSIGPRNSLQASDQAFDMDQRAFLNLTSLKMKNRDLKIMLSVGDWKGGGSEGFGRVSVNDTSRRDFAKNAVRFMRAFMFDGLDLNWQHPTFWMGGMPEDRDNYVLLAQTLREEFEREASARNTARLLLSMAISHHHKFLPAYDINNLNSHLDFINVLSYDYHFSYETAANHNSPLYNLGEDDDHGYDASQNIDNTIQYFSALASPEKLVLGIPLYGRTYRLQDPTQTTLGSEVEGLGDEGPYTQEKGFLATFEICNFVKNEGWTMVQTKPGSAGPYAYKGDQWVSFDDKDMIRTKATYANQKGLGGVMFWSMDYDDFQGDCSGESFPLIRVARDALNGKDNTVVPKTDKSGNDVFFPASLDPGHGQGTDLDEPPSQQQPTQDVSVPTMPIQTLPKLNPENLGFQSVRQKGTWVNPDVLPTMNMIPYDQAFQGEYEEEDDEDNGCAPRPKVQHFHKHTSAPVPTTTGAPMPQPPPRQPSSNQLHHPSSNQEPQLYYPLSNQQPQTHHPSSNHEPHLHYPSSNQEPQYHQPLNNQHPQLHHPSSNQQPTPLETPGRHNNPGTGSNTYSPSPTLPPSHTYTPAPTYIPVHAPPQTADVNIPQSNIVDDLVRLIEKAGGIKNFCDLLNNGHARTPNMVYKKRFNNQGEMENSLILKSPKVPPILLLLSNSSIYIKEVNVFHRPST